jgi:hypothetical protein
VGTAALGCPGRASLDKFPRQLVQCADETNQDGSSLGASWLPPPSVSQFALRNLFQVISVTITSDYLGTLTLGANLLR